jgi:hypothetical protein
VTGLRLLRTRAPRRGRPRARRPLAAIGTLFLGAAAALLVACGSSGKGLIPVADAGPLQRDFEAVAQAAETANGNCTATEAAIARTEDDFAALPSSVDAGLRRTLLKGIDHLRSRALALCAQPISTVTTNATTSTSPPTNGTTTTTPTTTTPTTPTQTTPPTTTEPPGPGGGTPAPGQEAPPPSGGGTGAGEGNGQEGGR